MNGVHPTEEKRQHLLERLLDAVKQCQIRFGGRKEIASDSDSRVICLCAQFEVVLQHGLRKTRGLALTAAALKHAAGLSSKAEADATFWAHVKEHLSRHELQRFYGLRNVWSEPGRGRAWLRCALNEHSLERYLHALLADRARLSASYEDWAFVLDQERASMLPTMAAGLNSILFSITIDKEELNGQSRAVSGVSGVSVLLKESAQGVSTLLREIGTATRPDSASDPLPVMPRSSSADSGLRKERRRKKIITNIISFDDDLDGGAAEDEEEPFEDLRKSITTEQSGSPALMPSQNGPFEHGTPSQNGDSLENEEDEDEEDRDVYSRNRAESRAEPGSSETMAAGSLPSVSTWSPRQVIMQDDGPDLLVPVGPADADSPTGSSEDTGTGAGHARAPGESGKTTSPPPVSFCSSPPVQPGAASSALPPTGHPDAMTVAELRQAIVAMMNRKDELSEQNTSLRSLLDGEMQHSALLRQELDCVKTRLSELEERHTAKVQALGRENEVLKVQLKKYVGAVQMLKREGNQGNDALPLTQDCDAAAAGPQHKAAEDVEELAASYERKLIEVAEMHGELIEFNERLFRSLLAKDHLINQMRQELIDLRGPLPGDLSQTSDDPSLSDFETSHRALVNVWIPSVFLQGRAANAYHVYQVYIRILDTEWNVYRRYTEFRALHTHLRTRFPQVDAYNFPPKKAIGNKDSRFVEERRKQLQSYLRTVMNKLIQAQPEFAAQPSRETLLRLLPFCRDSPQAGDAGTRTPRSKTSSRFPRLGRNQNRDARNPEPQSGDL
ncbi:sorting nexin-29-like [Denticeps clupeoides]|uniref:Sorting nexin-29 n=1 Tax=Denticeps clupeoides TaxID=299321 RepID=A0AAY4C950_9TELE|nr:sorting nexin-29-like [Denticeps clupeoides]